MTRSLRIAAGLVLLAFLTACPSLHLQRGDEYAAKGDWAQAVRAYAKARSEDPEDPVIAAKLARARVALAEISLTAGDEAITNDDLAAAWKHLANAIEAAPQDPRVDSLRTRLREATAKRIRDALAKAEYDAAYADLGRLQTQDPDNAEIGKLATEIALSVLANAQKLESQGAYFQARQRLLQLSERQPGYAKEAKSKIASLNTRWANHLRDLAAKDERKKRWTSAYVRRAMAAGITQNHTDRKQKARLEGLFLEVHGVVISTEFLGDAHRVNPLRETLAGAIAHGGTVRWTPGVKAADLAGTLSLERPTCEERHEDRPATQRYLAGQRPVPNPEYVARADIIDRAAAALEVTAQQVRAHRARIGSLEGAILESRRNESTLTRALRQARTAVDDARVEEAKALDRLDASAKGTAAIGQRDAAQKALWDARDAENAAKVALQEAQDAADAQAARQSVLQKRAEGAKAALAKAKKALKETPKGTAEQRALAGRLDALQAAMGKAQAGLDAATKAVARAKAAGKKAAVAAQKTKYKAAKKRLDAAKAEHAAAEKATETIEAEAAAQRSWEKAQTAARKDGASATGAPTADLPALQARLSASQQAVKDAEAKLKALPPLTREQRTLAGQRASRLDAVKRARKDVQNALRAQYDARSRRSAQRLRSRTLDEEREDTTIQLQIAQDQVHTQGVALARRRAAIRFIPDTVLEDVFADFPYTVRHWTKKCRLRADMKGARPRQPGANQHLVSWAETNDTSNRGYRHYDVAPNAFKYPKTDAQLFAKAHADLVPLMQAWLERSLDTIRQARLDSARGRPAQDKEAALADLLVAWRLDRDAIPKELSALLTETYGHLEMAWLN